MRGATTGDPHPFIGLGRFSILLQYLYSALICADIVAAVLALTYQVDQRQKGGCEFDYPVGHVGTAHFTTVALEDPL